MRWFLSDVENGMELCYSITAKFFSRHKKMATTRASTWSVTINNPVASDEENIALARQRGWKVEGQLEKGKEGTVHYQLMVKTPQVRFSALKKAFPRAHIEVARNVVALEQYVHKDETREGQLASASELYPSLQKMWDMLAEYIQDYKLHHTWYDCDAESRLQIFDKFVADAIEQGFVLESMAANPQTRSMVKLYGEAIYNRSIRRQTDRQTDKNIVEVDKQNVLSSPQVCSQEESAPSPHGDSPVSGSDSPRTGVHRDAESVGSSV